MKDIGLEPHPWYGPCDGFGPGHTCSECTGLVERGDGSIVTLGDEIVLRKPPLAKRIRAAWRVLTYADGWLPPTP
jgi:hypothetical protein